MAAKKKITNKKVDMEVSKETRVGRHPLVSMAGTIGGVLFGIALITLIFSKENIVGVMQSVTIPLVVLAVILGFFVYKKL